jgi:hypothetical protein
MTREYWRERVREGEIAVAALQKNRDVIFLSGGKIYV